MAALADFDKFLCQHARWDPKLPRPLTETIFCNFLAHHRDIGHTPGTTLTAVAGVVSSLATLGIPDPRTVWPSRATYDMVIKGFQRTATNRPLATAHGLRAPQSTKPKALRTPTLPLTPTIWRQVTTALAGDTAPDMLATLAIMAVTMAASARLNELLPTSKAGYPPAEYLKELHWRDIVILPQELGTAISIKMRKTDQAAKGASAIVARDDTLGMACPHATFHRYLAQAHPSPQPMDLVFVHAVSRQRITARWYTSKAEAIPKALGIPKEALRGHSGHAGMSQAMRAAGCTEETINLACGWAPTSRVAVTSYARQDVTQTVTMQRAAHQIQYTFHPMTAQDQGTQQPTDDASISTLNDIEADNGYYQ